MYPVIGEGYIRPRPQYWDTAMTRQVTIDNVEDNKNTKFVIYANGTDNIGKEFDTRQEAHEYLVDYGIGGRIEEKGVEWGIDTWEFSFQEPVERTFSNKQQAINYREENGVSGRIKHAEDILE